MFWENLVVGGEVAYVVILVATAQTKKNKTIKYLNTQGFST